MHTISKKKEAALLLSVTIGSLLEWYEIYLYIYWAPLLAKIFFPEHTTATGLVQTFLVFSVGFLGRPIGGLLFGRMGDLKGRKVALIASVTLILFPTFLMGVLPSYERIGIAAPLLFAFLRFMQSLPAGGELPGAFCFLYESAHPDRRRYLTSWAGVGGQVGVMISMMECFLLGYFLSPEDLSSWGWRVSFMMGGLIGLFGLFLRYRLHETPIFKELQKEHHLVKSSLMQTLVRHQKKIGIGILFGIFNSVGYYVISILFPLYFSHISGIHYANSKLTSFLCVFFMTAPMPFIGYLGDRWSNKKMLIGCTLTCMILLYPLYHLLQHSYSPILSLVAGSLFMVSFSISLALIPYRFASLFPASVRETCVGMSFNLVDGVIGGFIPAITLYLVSVFDSSTPFYWVLFISAFISFLAFAIMPKDKI